MSELEIGPEERPVYPPKVLRAEVLWNPFDDIVPRRLPEEPGAEPSRLTLAEERRRQVKATQ